MAKISITDAATAAFLRSTYWLADFCKGAKVRKHYNEIRRVHLRRPGWQDYRREKLAQLLRHAVDHCDFYRGIDPESLLNFPVINKTTLIENSDSIKVPESALPRQKGSYMIQHTSGSTGTPLSVPLDREKMRRRVAELKYFGTLVGFKSHDKLLQLRIWPKHLNRRRKRLRENIVAWDISNQSDENLEKLYRKLRESRCVGLRGYASSIDLLAKYVCRKKYEPLPYLKIAVCGSETLFDDTRNLVENYLGCDIISQYANEENGILAQQNVGKGRDFILNEASYFFEVLKFSSDEEADEGELGRIVITDLFNYAFPMIRYDTGDCGAIVKDTSGNRVFSQITGRRVDLVYDTKGNPMSPMTLPRTLKFVEGIIQWQFIQTGRKNYKLKLMVVPDVEKSRIEASIVDVIRQYFGADAEISFEYVEEIPVLASGKRKSMICEL